MFGICVSGFRVLNLNPTQNADVIRKRRARYQTLIEHRYA